MIERARKERAGESTSSGQRWFRVLFTLSHRAARSGSRPLVTLPAFSV
jgi:hypothetical protein